MQTTIFLENQKRIKKRYLADQRRERAYRKKQEKKNREWTKA